VRLDERSRSATAVTIDRRAPVPGGTATLIALSLLRAAAHAQAGSGPDVGQLKAPFWP